MIAKAEAGQATCSSLSPKPKSVYFLFPSVSGSSFSSPNFPNRCSPRESTSVFANYLRSHFSVSQPKTLRNRARSYFPSSVEPRALRGLACPFALLSPPLNFLRLPLASTAPGPDQVAYLMLKYLPRSGMGFLLHNFNLFWYLYSFPSIWRTFSIILIYKMRKPLDSPTSFRPICLTSCISKLFERIILSRLLFFLGSIFIFSPPFTVYSGSNFVPFSVDFGWVLQT